MTGVSEDGFAIAICSCTQGPYLGARKMGTPCCCERCGFMIQEQYDAIIRDAFAGWVGAAKLHREKDCNGYALGSSCNCRTATDCPASGGASHG